MTLKALIPLVLSLPLVVVLAACSSLETSYDFDTHTDFASFHVYAWTERAASDAGSDLVYDRIVRAVDENLAAKGYVRGDKPDFHVAARTGNQTRVSVTDWGYSYGAYASWYPRRDVSVQEYEVGTLILDVVDASTMKLVWRGTAEDTLPTQPSPEEITKLVDHAVQKVLEAFPPTP